MNKFEKAWKELQSVLYTDHHGDDDRIINLLSCDAVIALGEALTLAQQSPPPASDEVREAIEGAKDYIQFRIEEEDEGVMEGYVNDCSVFSFKHLETLIQAATPQAGRSLDDAQIKAVWRMAMTAASNVCVRISNDYNADDGPMDKIDCALECKDEIAKWLHPADAHMEELRAALQPPPAPVTEDEAGEALSALKGCYKPYRGFLVLNTTSAREFVASQNGVVERALRYFAKKGPAHGQG